MEFNEKLHRRIRWPAVLHILLPLLAAFTALMVVGRLISGVHWLSDIIGSILLSAGLVLLYAANRAASYNHRREWLRQPVRRKNRSSCILESKYKRCHRLVYAVLCRVAPKTAYDGYMIRVGTAAPPAEGWDIHCHTVFSDGTETPRALLQEARALRLHGVAIADHDTTSGWQDALAASREVRLPLLRGTEITAVDESVSVHMLAFQYDPLNADISEMFASTREARLRRTKRMVELMAQDFPITWDDVLAQVREGKRTTIGRPHIADALVAAGVYETRSDAFADAVSATSKYYIPTPSPTTHDVVAAVKGAGGVVVIAHAGDPRRNRTLLTDRQIESLITEGLDGLEVWHRGNPSEQRERLLTIARRHDLLVTGGSDWHGKGKPNALGENLTSDETVQEIINRGVRLSKESSKAKIKNRNAIIDA